MRRCAQQDTQNSTCCSCSGRRDVLRAKLANFQVRLADGWLWLWLCKTQWTV